MIETLLMIRAPSGSRRSTRTGRSTSCCRSAPRRSGCRSPRSRRKTLDQADRPARSRTSSSSPASRRRTSNPRLDPTVAAVRQGGVRRSEELEDRRVPAAHRQGVDRAARRLSGGEGARAGVRDVPAAAGRRVRARAAAPRRGARSRTTRSSSAWSRKHLMEGRRPEPEVRQGRGRARQGGLAR